MRGDAQTVKERVDIVEVIGGYIKLEKSGVNFKACCPFHTEKTASFHISPSRQAYYCFGCGEKGDVYTFVEKMEGTDFRGALKMLADKAGIELEFSPNKESRGEKDRLFEVLEEATSFFEEQLKAAPVARDYVLSRGISESTVKSFRIGFAPDEWRALRAHILSKGFSDEELAKSGLAKRNEDKGGEPYDVFRGRIVFPLMDASGRVIAFSGRALEKDAVPKYLNSPDTALFQKSEVLYGFDKAKDAVRKKNYAVLVEGQMDLVLSHQAGVTNTVASSGTAFTVEHLNRLRRLSARLILAFDADAAGEKAAAKSTELGLGLGMEVKVAKLPPGKDPADLVRESPDAWKEVLRSSKTAIEFFLDKVMEEETDPRKLGLAIGKRILPLVALLESAIERAHFVSLIGKRTSLKEEVLWEDLKKIVRSPSRRADPQEEASENAPKTVLTRKEMLAERLKEINVWKKDVSKDEAVALAEEEKELTINLGLESLHEELSVLKSELARAEGLKDDTAVERLSRDILAVHSRMKALEEERKVL